LANTLNITINQGADFERLLTLKSDAVTTINLTGYTFRGQAREAFDSKNAAFSFVFALKNQTTNEGQVDWSLANTALTALKLSASTNYVYDVEMVSPGGIVTRILEGTATVNPEVTKS
jgi:hypothetical protein